MSRPDEEAEEEVAYNPHGDDDTNALQVSCGGSKGKGKRKEGEEKGGRVQGPRVSKEKLRRVRQCREKAERLERRKEVLESLAKTMIKPEEAQLYHSSCFVGRKETNRQHLRRLRREERAGISVTAPEGKRSLTVEVDAPDPDSLVVEEPVTQEKEEKENEEGQCAIGEEVEEVEERERRERKGRQEKKGFFDKGRSQRAATSVDPHEDLDVEDDAVWKARQAERLKALGDSVVPPPPPPASTELDVEAQQEEEEDGGEESEEEEETEAKADEVAAAGTLPQCFGFGAFVPPEGVSVVTKKRKAPTDGAHEESGRAEDSNVSQVVVLRPATAAEPAASDIAKIECGSPQRKKRRSTLVFTETRIQTAPPAIPLKSVVPLARPPEVVESRQELPITMHEQEVMEAVLSNPVCIVSGETGCGKTTQVPQFLYEAGFGSRDGLMIGVTQPRRVAATSMARRVAFELGLGLGKEVAYQVRYDSLVDRQSTRIKFMTDGILLREVQGDFLLRSYGVIVIDEAHERNLNTDILLGLLSRIVMMRNSFGSGHPPLKLIIMSATLRVEDFTQNQALFPSPPPLVKVPARQHPVTVHFNRKTNLEDYCGEAFSKVIKIHTRLPQGGILVFLTGQREILRLCARLRKRFPEEKAQTKSTKPRRAQEASRQKEEATTGEDNKTVEQAMEEEENGDAGGLRANRDPDEEDVGDGDDYEELLAEEGEEEDDDELLAQFAAPSKDGQEAGPLPLHVMPLYSALEPEKQRQVFEPPPPGTRLVIVATNVAETALTIPGITYVVDSGKVKQRRYDPATGISAFVVTWISKASADQRAGRAGRVGPGHCYRLYSSSVYNDVFPKYSDPEILCTPVEDVLLQMKAMGIDKTASFPFPTPPTAQSIDAALKTLRSLSAIDCNAQARITALGKAMSKFPVSPRLGKMLVLAHRSSCLPWVVTIVAALSVRDLFSQMHTSSSSDAGGEEDSGDRKRLGLWADSDSDLLAALKAVEACRHALQSGSDSVESFCRRYSLHQQSMDEILKLRAQLCSLLATPVSYNVVPPPPNQAQRLLIRQIIAGGFPDHLAKLVQTTDPQRGGPAFRYRAHGSASGEFVSIHPTSFLGRDSPQYVVFNEITEAESSSRAYMRGVTAVQPEWMASVAPTMVTFSEPLAVPPPKFDRRAGVVKCYVKASYGAEGWQLPLHLVPHPESHEKYRHFLQFLLLGQVFPALAPFVPHLTVQAASVAKCASSKVFSMLSALLVSKVDSRASFIRKLKQDPSWLLREYGALLQDDSKKRAELAQVWPSLSAASS